MALRQRFVVCGWIGCGAYKGARDALLGLSRIFPSRIEVRLSEYPSRDEYMTWLTGARDEMGVPTHKTSPLVWTVNEEGERQSIVGGRDDTITWARNFVSVDSSDSNEAKSLADNIPVDHGYDYDLVVIGGGSGGLATGRAAANLGAKVAILDFVKPSPAGSKWGLGGTCVNVGCIPKKLMHNAALVGEHGASAESYGWIGTPAKHDWNTLRQNVQDHIKGLNFGYKVSLREEKITYHNKLGKFIDEHTIECTDNKGKTSQITGARFVVAVGGRPQPLDIPGGEHAITSDDIFMKKTPPGKTCVVGAGYVALECAGFLTSLKGGDVTVLVRSILLRGFDRDVVDNVQKVMEHNGTVIKTGVLPASIEKLDSGKLLVTLNDGTSDEFDTVLAARGRYMDLSQLGIGPSDAVPLVTGKSGKLITTDEQTSVPHIYAVGDIIEGVPELTPSAIQAGRLLAKRLYSNSTEAMDYKSIATTVFTPLEFGTVGLTEDEAIEKFGAENVDCYMSKFQPLEWTICQEYADLSCIAKIVVDMSNNQKVLGMHIGAPNAGEIIQGFGVAFRKGLYYKDLIGTVGIHPTIAEEFVDMAILKSSGDDTAKKGC